MGLDWEDLCSIWLVLKRNQIPHCLRKRMIKYIFLFESNSLPVIKLRCIFRFYYEDDKKIIKQIKFVL